MNSPITTLPGFPFFYAIPIDSHIQEVPSQPQIWSDEIEGVEGVGDTFLLFHPPPYSKAPQESDQGLFPVLEEADESLGMIPVIVPDNDMITPETVHAKPDPITKTKSLRRKIRYPSLAIGRWAQPSPKDNNPSGDFPLISGRPPRTSIKPSLSNPLWVSAAASMASVNIDACDWGNEQQLHFPSIPGRPPRTSIKPSLSNPLWVSAAAASADIDETLAMAPQLDEIQAVSPISPFSELDSTPVSELSSERSSELSTPFIPLEGFDSLPELPSNEQQSFSALSIRTGYTSWYAEDDANGLSVPSRPDESSDLPSSRSRDSPPPFHSDSETSSAPLSSPAPSYESESLPGYTSNRCSQWSQSSKDFEGDIKENVPDMARLPARRQSIILMTEEEVFQAEIIEDIFLMLHGLQPDYLHPARRPQPNVVRASVIRRIASQITKRRRTW